MDRIRAFKIGFNAAWLLMILSMLLILGVRRGFEHWYSILAALLVAGILVNALAVLLGSRGARTQTLLAVCLSAFLFGVVALVAVPEELLRFLGAGAFYGILMRLPQHGREDAPEDVQPS